MIPLDLLHPNLSYAQYLVIVSVFWIVLLIMWLRVLIWNMKLTKTNEELHTQLRQAQEEIERLQSKNSPELDMQHQHPSVCSEKHDNRASHNDVSN